MHCGFFSKCIFLFTGRAGRHFKVTGSKHIPHRSSVSDDVGQSGTRCSPGGTTASCGGATCPLRSAPARSHGDDDSGPAANRERAVRVAGDAMSRRHDNQRNQ